MKIKSLTKNSKIFLKKNSPTILTGIGIAGMITTFVLSVKATPKALKLIELAEDAKEDKLTKTEIVKECWKCYIPATITGVMSIACIIGASNVNLKRNAALAAAYSLSENALKEYKEKVTEVVGEKKAKEVKNRIVEDKMKKNPKSNNEVIITGKGKTLCYDVYTDRYFESDIEHIKRAVNNVNKQMLSEDFITLNEFYSELGLKSVKMGDKYGWHIDKGLLELDLGSMLSDDGMPCITMDFVEDPVVEY